MISILSPTAFRIFSNGSIAVFICAAVMKRPSFSFAAGSNGQIFMAEMPLLEQALGQARRHGS